MAEHTYKPGDVVSVRTRLVRDDEPGFGFPGTSPQFTFRDIEPEYARWLSDEEQDSLLRVVRAALDTHRWRTARGETPSTELAWSLNALSPAIRERVARLSEGG